MKQVYKFEGSVSWVKTTPNKFGKYDLNFYPKNAVVRKNIKDTGIKNRPQEDDEGNFFYILRSPEPYGIIDDKGQGITALVGNGSTATVELEVEKFTSPAHGPQARSRLICVIVHDLIPYTRPEPEADTGLPA